MEKIVIATDSFKGSASSQEVADDLQRGLMAANAGLQIKKVPLADGGEGTVTAVVGATKGQLMTTKVTGSAGSQIDAEWGLIDNQTAVIEMAAAAGYTQGQKTDVTLRSTYGVGELIEAALDHGVNKIFLGLGGSSTNDGGVGMAQALGGHFYDRKGHEISRGIGGLKDLEKVDLSQIDQRIHSVQVVGLSDVMNPLVGKSGATAIFGPQKGVQKAQIAAFDAQLQRLARLTADSIGQDFSSVSGAGAAGGLGFGALAFLNGRLTSGIDEIMKLVNLKALIRDADWVITGEGRIDSQTLSGKLPMGVAKLAHSAKVRVIAVAGSLATDIQPLYDQRFDLIVSTTTRPVTVPEAIHQAPQLIQQTGFRIGKLIQLIH